MRYFAYGSNMDSAEMQGTCSSAVFLCLARFSNHKVAFPRCSRDRGCGVAGVVEARGQSVWGVVYQIAECDVAKLDRKEGYRPGRAKNSYDRKARHVYRNGDETDPLSVQVYFARPEVHPPLPDEKYKNLIVNAAKFWGLPKEYVSGLEKIRCSRRRTTEHGE